MYTTPQLHQTEKQLRHRKLIRRVPLTFPDPISIPTYQTQHRRQYSDSSSESDQQNENEDEYDQGSDKIEMIKEQKLLKEELFQLELIELQQQLELLSRVVEEVSSLPSTQRRRGLRAEFRSRENGKGGAEISNGVASIDSADSADSAAGSNFRRRHSNHNNHFPPTVAILATPVSPFGAVGTICTFIINGVPVQRAC